jgi:hypothetical protein
VAIEVIAAGQNARPYVRDNRQYHAFVRVETHHGEITIPIVDWPGAKKMRDTLATLVNARRGHKPVAITEVVKIGNGQEVTLADGETPKEMIELREKGLHLYPQWKP